MSAATGESVEAMHLYGIPSSGLSANERADIVEYAASFEECGYSKAELSAMSNADLVGAAYAAMRDYTRGMM